eukprot:TRINITY_DN6615_c0_g1_i1.p1 TRINITY_DN6615_c0_g1~~TRINITY_DN6615_c0_g1_i1.p1  ORF type:complete len:410 (-),score=100.67 TRINITY_DN6615_c0_g1_i1:139-1368(-)
MLEIAEAEDVRELIRYGFVGVEDRWPGDISLLHKAVQSKQRALVRMLLISGADVFATTSIREQNALHYACDTARPSVDVVRLLLSAARDTVEFALSDSDAAERAGTYTRLLNARSKTGLTPLGMLARSSTASAGLSAAAELVLAGADVDAPCEHGRTPLHLAVQRGNGRMAQFLLEQGADVDHPNLDGLTPLMVAAREHVSWDATGYLLLASGADISKTTPSNSTALHEACRAGLRKAAAYLLKHGADPGVQEQVFGWTPLHIVCDVFDPSEAVFLFDGLRAYRNVPDKRGWTPLHWACHSARVDLIEHLLRHGANRRAKTLDGKDACELVDELRVRGRVRHLFETVRPMRWRPETHINFPVAEQDRVATLMALHAVDGDTYEPLVPCSFPFHAMPAELMHLVCAMAVE